MEEHLKTEPEFHNVEEANGPMNEIEAIEKNEEIYD